MRSQITQTEIWNGDDQSNRAIGHLGIWGVGANNGLVKVTTT